MPSSYRGQYRLGPKDDPTDIQVVDTGGVSIPLPIDMYISRKVLPEWRLLPTEQEYQVLQSVAKLERGESVWINAADAEDCLKAGWIQPSTLPQWILTPAGLNLLG